MSGAGTLTGPGFPFGVPADPEDESRDRRGADTANRLLLHGARYHDRREVFLDWERGRRGAWAWQGTPDWRADRSAIRVALVLRQRLEVSRGETVALWMPLSREFACVERGCWSTGAISVPVWPEWELERVAAVLADASPQALFAPDRRSLDALRVTGGLPDSVRASIVLAGQTEEDADSLPFAKLMEYGGVLDTPERASMWRTSAREAGPDEAIAWEYGETGEERREVDHRALVEAAAGLLDRFPARRGRLWALADGRPDPLSRAALYAGWADGLTRVAFAASEEARGQLGGLRPELVLCRSADATGIAELLGPAEEPAAPTPGRRRGLLAWLTGSGNGSRAPAGGNGAGESAGRADLVYCVLTDLTGADPGPAARPGGRVRFVPRAEFGGLAGLPVS